MKKIIFSVLLVLAFVNSNAQQKKMVQKEAEQTVINFFEALSALDFDKMRYYTKNIKLVEYGEVWNIDTLINAMKPSVGKNEKRINTLVFLDTEIKENTAWLIYNNTADFEADGKKGRMKWLE
ncbi:MAG: hypothetical protein EOO87_02850, partial [Pedobacter sp.]